MICHFNFIIVDVLVFVRFVTVTYFHTSTLHSYFPMSLNSYTKTPLMDSSPIMQGTEADKAADFANYFCSYAYLYHQKQMLMDHVRMRAYHTSIMANKDLFHGKVVLDVGTGSGVLSIWAAQAGAAKV